MKKLTVFAAMLAIVIFLAVSTTAADVIDAGDCGDSLTWTLTDDGVLKISGEGAMWDYDNDENPAPWYPYLHDKENETTLEMDYGITSIGGYAFYECYGLVGKLSIPKSVTVIGNYAFFSCLGFTGDLIIPDSVTTIVGMAFAECGRFNGKLIIPDTVTEIGWGAFQNCGGLIGPLSIPSNLKAIEGYTFAGCSGLNGNLNIPYGVTEIGWGAFMDCSGFTGQLAIPSSVSYIDGYAFAECSNLTGYLIIPNGVEKIGWGAFMNCSGFTEWLSLPEGLAMIDGEVFKGCSGLSGELTLPKSLTYLGDRAFEGCDQIPCTYLECAAPEAGVVLFGERDDSFKLYCRVEYKESYTADEEYDEDTQKWHGYKLKFYGNSLTISEKADSVTFGIVPIESEWTPDGTIHDGEYGEILLDSGWMSYAMWSETEKDYLMNLGERLYMSWDEKYVYLASVYTPEVHSCVWDETPEYMWYSGCMEIGIACYGETESNRRNDYGVGISSVTNQNLYCTWSNGIGTGYQISSDDAVMFLDNGTLTYESRIPWTAIYSDGWTADTKGLNLCIVWSVGEEQNYAHIQLASGMTGFGVHAENYAKVTLITALDLLCEEVAEQLDEVIDKIDAGTDAETIQESVQDIGKEKLHDAMEADSDDTGVIQQLQVIEESIDATVTVEVAEAVDDFDESLVSIVGALLNPLEQNEVTLNITKPKSDDVIPEEYDNTIAIRFCMELDGVQNTSDLVVPVKITLPVPGTLDPASLKILHYPADGSQPEVIRPNVFEKDGQWYASFVIDHFSDFVMTEEKTIIIADLNGDGNVNQKDLAMLSKYMRNSTLYPLNKKAMLAADINGDGYVNQKDLAKLSKYMRNKTAYPLA